MSVLRTRRQQRTVVFYSLSSSVYPLAKSAGTSLRKLRATAAQKPVGGRTFWLLSLRTTGQSAMMKRNGSAIGAVYLLCILPLSASLSPSLTHTLTSMVHFNPPQFLAGGSAEQKAPFRAAYRSFGLFSSSLSCCYITVN